MLFLLACTPEQPVAIGSGGGVIEIAGARLEIPPGALTEPQVVTLRALDEPTPDPWDGVSPTFAIEPLGLVFDREATLTLSHPPALETAGVFGPPSSLERRTPTLVESGSTSFWISGGGHAFVAQPPRVEAELLYQPQPADVLIVLDTSASMAAFEEDRTEAAVAFVEALEESDLDYHVGVVNMDSTDPINGQGKLRNAGGNNFVHPDLENQTQILALMMGMPAGPGSDGRSAAYTMVQVKARIPRNHGFRRPEATLDLLFVSDDDDRSGNSPVSQNEFVAWMDNLAARPSDVRANAIVRGDGASCGGNRGHSYLEVAQASDGVVGELCEGGWVDVFQQMLDARVSEGHIELPDEPLEVFAVHVGAATLAPEDYAIEGRFLRFVGFRPAPDALVTVSYRPGWRR